MRRTICVALWSAVVFMTAPAARPGDAPARPPGAWGETIDPDGDCTVTFREGKVTVRVPGSRHDLSAELGLTNAPRVLREVEGDFIAEVEVAGAVRPGGASDVPGRTPYNGAGLLLWVGAGHYLRLERACLIRPDNGGAQTAANFELREGGEIAQARPVAMPDEPYHLRLERRGNRVVGSVSPDGLSWAALGTIETELPAKVRLGVVAINSTTAPFTAELEGFAVYRREPLAR